MCRFQAKMFLNLKIFFQILRKVILLNTWTRCKTTIEVTQLEFLAAVHEPHQLVSHPLTYCHKLHPALIYYSLINPTY